MGQTSWLPLTASFTSRSLRPYSPPYLKKRLPLPSLPEKKIPHENALPLTCLLFTNPTRKGNFPIHNGCWFLPTWATSCSRPEPPTWKCELPTWLLCYSLFPLVLYPSVLAASLSVSSGTLPLCFWLFCTKFHFSALFSKFVLPLIFSLNLLTYMFQFFFLTILELELLPKMEMLVTLLTNGYLKNRMGMILIRF